ncbi:MAG: SulP family inorganic anion transporter [Acidimicrobiia bacterium]
MADQPTQVREASATGLRRFIPLLAWLPGYRGTGGFRRDLIAGISVAALLIPESMGYAEIAGVPPEVGLYAAPAALIAYAVFGSSRLLVVATASAVAAVSAGIVGSLSGGDEEAAIALSGALAVVAGLIFLVAGLARLGWVSNFMSKAVMEGFIVGLSISIIIGQLDALAGVEVEGENAIAELFDLLSQIGSWSSLTLVFGIGSLAALFAMEYFLPRIPGALTVVVVAIVLVSVFDLDAEGLAIVGEIPRGLPEFGIPDVEASQWLALIPGAFAIVLVGFSEGFAAGNDVAAPGEHLDANQEFIGYGASSLGAGLSGGMVVSGSLSKTAANREAGAVSQMSNIVNAGIVLLTLVLLAPLFTNLPEATLGAIVIHAVWKSADPRRLLPFRRIQPIEFWLAVTVLVAVLVIGEIQAVILGVVISLLIIVYRVSFPRSTRLGRDPETGYLVAVDRTEGAQTTPGIIVYRFEAPLIYSNAAAFERDAVDLVQASDVPVTMVVIDGEGIFEIDASGAESLVSLIAELRAVDVSVRLARVHTPVYEALERGGLIDDIGADAFDAVPEDALPPHNDGG